MKNNNFTIFLVLVFQTAVHGQGLLIGPGVRNGDFELGTAEFWRRVTVASNAGFAAEGTNYGIIYRGIDGSGTGHMGLAMQFLPAVADGGLDFLLVFQARTDAVGFTSVAVTADVRSTSGPLNAVVTVLQSAPLATSGWQEYQFLLQFDRGEWIDDLSLGIYFTRPSYESGAFYTGYLDNVRLTQIPEPGAAGLVLLGAGLALFARRLKTRHPRLKIIPPQPGIRLEV